MLYYFDQAKTEAAVPANMQAEAVAPAKKPHWLVERLAGTIHALTVSSRLPYAEALGAACRQAEESLKKGGYGAGRINEFMQPALEIVGKKHAKMRGFQDAAPATGKPIIVKIAEEKPAIPAGVVLGAEFVPEILAL